MIELSPIVTAWCAAAATLLLEHLLLAPRPTPYWKRYAMGVASILVGVGVWSWLIGRLWIVLAVAAISTSGAIVLAGYVLRNAYDHDIHAAQEAGRLEGRAVEASRTTREGGSRDR